MDRVHSADCIGSIPTELVARLEVASDGSLALDKAILAHLGFTWRGMNYWNSANKMWTGPANLSRSLDAALALAERVLPGLCWSVGQNVHHKHWTAYGLHILPDGEVETLGLDSAATPALALCIAIMKARTAAEADSVGIANGDEPNPPTQSRKGE